MGKSKGRDVAKELRDDARKDPEPDVDVPRGRSPDNLRYRSSRGRESETDSIGRMPGSLPGVAVDPPPP